VIPGPNQQPVRCEGPIASQSPDVLKESGVEAELKALREEISALRGEIAALRGQVVYHNPMIPTPAPAHLPWTVPGGWPAVMSVSGVCTGEIGHNGFGPRMTAAEAA
jgi:hypothetical protein